MVYINQSAGFDVYPRKKNTVTLRNIPASLIALSSLCISWSNSFATDVTVAFGKDRAPYVMQNTDNGISVDLFRAALAYKGHVLKPFYMSAANAPEAISHRVDAIANSPAIGADPSHFHSDTYLSLKDCVITKSASGIDLERLDDLTGHRITAWSGAHKYLGEEFSALFAPENVQAHSSEYLEHANQQAQNQMFWRDYADIIIVDKHIFRWYRNTLSKKIDTSDSVDVHYLLPRETLVRATFKQEDLRDDFNEGIQALKANGEYQRIIQSYVRSAPAQLEQVIVPPPAANASRKASTSPVTLKK